MEHLGIFRYHDYSATASPPSVSQQGQPASTVMCLSHQQKTWDVCSRAGLSLGPKLDIFPLMMKDTALPVSPSFCFKSLSFPVRSALRGHEASCCLNLLSELQLQPKNWQQEPLASKTSWTFGFLPFLFFLPWKEKEQISKGRTWPRDEKALGITGKTPATLKGGCPTGFTSWTEGGRI